MEMSKKRKDAQINPPITQHAAPWKESGTSTTQPGSENGNRTSERDKLLGIFPEEIWELIIDGVKEPNDLENISIASPFFKNLIQPRKVIYLFPKVWQILAMKYEQRSLKDSSYNQVIDENDPETRARGYKPPNGSCDCGGEKHVPWFAGILNMRGTCRTWCNVIDAYYQNIPLTARFPDALPRSKNMTHEYFVDGIPRPLRFTQHFAKTHVGVDRQGRSPFIGRTILFGLHFDEEHTPEYQQYLNALWLILQTFGCHVLHCEINCSSTAETAPAFYRKLSESLNLMPNLKTFQIMFMPPDFQLEITFTQDQITQLNSAIGDKPMNGMEHLQRLRVEYFLPVPIFNEIIRCSGNVSRLDWNVPKDYITENISLPNLKQISIILFSETDFQNFFRSAVEWKLETLKLGFASEVFVDWADIFAVINGSRWTESLTDLTIMLPYAQQRDQRTRIATEYNSLRLHLTALKRLKLDVDDVSCLDLILPMSETLECLNIGLRWSEEEVVGHMDELLGLAENNQTVNFVGYFDRPLESNVWTIFKKLKRFDFDGCIQWIGGALKSFKWSHSRFDWWKSQKCDKI